MSATTDESRWLVVPAADHADAYAVLAQDRIGNAYALADLEPPFDRDTTVSIARRAASDRAESACLILRGPDFTAMVTYGDAFGLTAILRVIDLPDSTHISARDAHLPVLREHFALSHSTDRWRMGLTAATFRPAPASTILVSRLGPPDSTALASLYSQYDESFFVPSQLVEGVFYGVWRRDALCAAAGTHLVARRAGIAAVGNVFTLPDMRGHGLGAAVTDAVVRDLVEEGIPDIVLNVAIDNQPALAIYRRLGFREHNRHWECSAVRSPSTARAPT